jgi:hypothetical protein
LALGFDSIVLQKRTIAKKPTIPKIVPIKTPNSAGQEKTRNAIIIQGSARMSVEIRILSLSFLRSSILFFILQDQHQEAADQSIQDKNDDKDRFGIEHTGMAGDVIIGSFFDEANTRSIGRQAN